MCPPSSIFTANVCEANCMTLMLDVNEPVVHLGAPAVSAVLASHSKNSERISLRF